MLDSPAASNAPAIPRFRSRLLRGIGMGLPGVLSLLLVVPHIPEVPRPALLVNPLLLLVAMSAAGAACAPRAGLGSRLLLGGSIGSKAPLLLRMLALGALIGGGIAGVDQLLAQGWQGSSAVPSLLDGWSRAQFVVGVLYGGITEEIVMRWGLLSLILWALVWLFGAGSRTRRTAAGIALILSAAAFAAGHLPAVLLAGEPTPMLLIRTLGLNFALGLLFGLAFLRHHLEAAIALHAGFHMGVAVVALIVLGSG